MHEFDETAISNFVREQSARDNCAEGHAVRMPENGERSQNRLKIIRR